MNTRTNMFIILPKEILRLIASFLGARERIILWRISSAFYRCDIPRIYYLRYLNDIACKNIDKGDEAYAFVYFVSNGEKDFVAAFMRKFPDIVNRGFFYAMDISQFSKLREIADLGIDWQKALPEVIERRICNALWSLRTYAVEKGEGSMFRTTFHTTVNRLSENDVSIHEFWS